MEPTNSGRVDQWSQCVESRYVSSASGTDISTATEASSLDCHFCGVDSPPAHVKWKEWWWKTLCPGLDTHTHTHKKKMAHATTQRAARWILPPYHLRKLRGDEGIPAKRKKHRLVRKQIENTCPKCPPKISAKKGTPNRKRMDMQTSKHHRRPTSKCCSRGLLVFLPSFLHLPKANNPTIPPATVLTATPHLPGQRNSSATSIAGGKCRVDDERSNRMGSECGRRGCGLVALGPWVLWWFF